MINNRIARLSGYSSALPTPFKGCFIDEEAFAAFCEWQIGEGISALVVNGTTGEAPTLTAEEQRQLIRLAVDVADGRVPVIRRCRIERHRARHRACSSGGVCRRRRAADCHALLQPSLPGGAFPSLRGASPRDKTADFAL